MRLQKIFSGLRKNGFNFFVLLLIGVLIISPTTKGWVMQQLLSTGIFNAEINKGGVDRTASNSSFGFTDAQGLERSTASLKGKVVFINFWASWCPPCRAEMPSLYELYNKFKADDRFVFLFINEDDDMLKARNYLNDHGLSIPLLKPSGTVPAAIFDRTLPTTAILDKEGNVVLQHKGMANYNTEKFIKQLEELL